MMLRCITGAMLALAVAASPALACQGDEIYSDNFTDAGGLWATAPWFTIGGGFAEFKVPAGSAGMIPYLGGDIKEFDVCVDITNPAFKSSEAPPVAGFAFWFKDFENMVAAVAAPIGVMFSFRNTNGRSVLAAPPRKHASIKTGAGATNTFRVTAKGNNITMYANDQRVAAFRVPPGDGLFGLLAESERDQVSSWKFSNFRLTEAPK